MWLPTYTGRDLVRGYRKCYGVDTVAAILELRQLGVQVPAARLAQAKETERQACARRAARKDALEYGTRTSELDETFAFVAGYTSGGAPYGTTWGELAEECADATVDPQDCSE